MGVSLEKMKNPLPVTQEAFCDFVWGNREVLDEMFKEAKEAREEGIEVGVAICEEDGALFLGERSKGEKHTLHIEPCRKGNTVGDVHTHTGVGLPEPSLGDVVGSLHYGRHFNCIISEGLLWSPIVSCYHFKRTPEVKEIIRTGEEIEREYKQVGLTADVERRLEEFEKLKHDAAPKESAERACTFSKFLGEEWGRQGKSP
ncbi:hypothetical protein ES703_78766 [subsurface metagenome]